MSTSRGEQWFVRFPRFAARFYDRLMGSASIRPQFREMAEQVLVRLQVGRLLEVGVGPGYLLLALSELDPRIELHGLDISPSMIARARTNLSGTSVEIRQGSIRRTAYQDGFFQAVVCSGSFYLWDAPQECLGEVHRILAPGGFACFFEPHRELPRTELRRLLKEKLRGESWTLRIVGPFGLNRAMSMTYELDQYAKIFQQSPFVDNFSIEKTALAGLPIWVRIVLRKPG